MDKAVVGEKMGNPSSPSRALLWWLLLIYPLSAFLYVLLLDAPFIFAWGYGLANLGYLLIAVAVISGRYPPLGLRNRLEVLMAAVGLWVFGTLLINIENILQALSRSS